MKELNYCHTCRQMTNHGTGTDGGCLKCRVTPPKTDEVEEIKVWFEQNYLDGDKIQEGQMLSSETCFEALTSLHQSQEELINRAWDYVVDATHAGSWSKKELEAYMRGDDKNK